MPETKNPFSITGTRRQEDLTDEDLITEWNYWNWEIVNAKPWGASLAAANEFGRDCERQMFRRKLNVKMVLVGDVQMTTIPTKPGFYWAKWRVADEGTDDNGEGCMGARANWEVVEVWENNLDPTSREHLRVSVGGVARGQSLENFHWHSNIALEAPK